ncbi:glycosyltransferase family protein [Hylemonella gracilis]|nr:hypothetical protein [Hylemonella gracilis]
MHAQTVMHLKDGLLEFERLARQQGLSETQVEAGRCAYFHELGIASFFYQSLQGLEEIHWVDSNSVLQRASTPQEAFEAVFGEMSRTRLSTLEPLDLSWMHRMLIRLNGFCIRLLLANRKKLLIIDGVRPSSQSFSIAARKNDSALVVLETPRKPPENLFKVIKAVQRSLGRALRLRGGLAASRMHPPTYFFHPHRVRSHMPEMKAVTAGIADDFRRKVFEISEPYMERIVGLTLGYERAMPDQMSMLKPAVISTDAINTSFRISACRVARKLGTQVVLFNHASHTPQSEAPSKTVGDLWASLGRIYSDHATVLAVRFPAIAGLIRELSPHGKKIIAVRQNSVLAATHSKPTFQITFAGNYVGENSHIPWMVETPDEFINGIAELAQAVGQIPEAKLVIRLKPQNNKTEINLAAIKQFVPHYPNVEISNGGSFKQALVETDLLVACISTTIDEALGAGRPVLLHSSRHRYNHLLGMSTPPDRNHRSAVYVSSKTPLVALLKGIIDAHQNRPLNAAELSTYTWPAGTPDMDEFAKLVLNMTQAHA